MVDAITNAAASGIYNATARVTAAASNIVNADTPGYTPIVVTSTQAPTGGVQTNVSQPSQAVQIAAPTAASNQEATETSLQIQQQQESDATHAFLDTAIGVYDAKASLIVLRVQQNLNKQLFDISA